MSNQIVLSDDLNSVLQRAVGEATFEVRVPSRGAKPQILNANAVSLPKILQQFENLRDWINFTTRLEDQLLSELSDVLKSTLGNHIENNIVATGLPLFLVGSCGHPYTVRQLALSCTSAAVFLGPKRVAKLLQDWERGVPIPYQSHVILFGVSVEEHLILDLGNNSTAQFQKLPKTAEGIHQHLPILYEPILKIPDNLGTVKFTVNHGARSGHF